MTSVQPGVGDVCGELAYRNPELFVGGLPFWMPAVRTLVLSLAAVLLFVANSRADDGREPVGMPAMMQAHMRANMRDHLAAISEIQSALAAAQYEHAADIAEQRLGMSSLELHGARHMAALMPVGMQAIGTTMHQAASRFARVAQEAPVSGGLSRALGALAEVSRQCVACHASYRLVRGQPH
ncbi:MAG: hypothetical protein P8Y27_09665 [Chromatiaceae bacterium]|jgi:hypothetical protein